MTCGIYGIVSQGNGRTYIGMSRNVERRWVQHRAKLNMGQHINAALQEDWSKQGESHFTFTLLQVAGPESLAHAEWQWCKDLQGQGTPLYNSDRLGGQPESLSAWGEMRVRRGVSQATLAAALGVNPAVVAAIDAGLVLPSEMLGDKLRTILE